MATGYLKRPKHATGHQHSPKETKLAFASDNYMLSFEVYSDAEFRMVWLLEISCDSSVSEKS